MLFLAPLVAAPLQERREAILAVDNLVIGSRRGGRWRETDLGFAKRHQAECFTTFGIGRVGKGQAFYGFGKDQPDGPTFLSSEDASSDMSPLISGVRPRVPRPVTKLPAGAVYEGIARAYLARKGVRIAKARLTALYRVDLDGDGTQEVLLEATSPRPAKDEPWPKGAYSVVLLRTVKGGIPLEFVTPNDGMMDVKRVRAVADLDGDGRMEILTTGNAEEYNKATLWSYRAGVPKKLLEGAAAY